MYFDKENNILKTANKEIKTETITYPNAPRRLEQCEIKSINELDFKISDFPKDIDFEVMLEFNKSENSKFDSSFKYNTFSIQQIEEKSKLVVSLFKYYLETHDDWKLVWDIKKFIKAVAKNISISHDLKVITINEDEQAIDINIAYVRDDECTMEVAILKVIEEIDIILRLTDIEMGGIKWKDEYEKNEQSFSKELVEPILRKLNFESVRYTHGTKEYGKDFICSERDKFGELNFIGIQVKAGNVSGKVNSNIDELIGQFDDAFSMPFYQLGKEDKLYISKFIILISGKFTDNAKEKIIEKTSKNLRSNLVFIDRVKLLNLIKEK